MYICCFTAQATVFQLYMWRYRCAGGLKKFDNYLGENYYITSCPGDRQLYSQLSIEIQPYNQLSGGQITIYPVFYHITNCLGERLLTNILPFFRDRTSIK